MSTSFSASLKIRELNADLTLFVTGKASYDGSIMKRSAGTHKPLKSKYSLFLLLSLLNLTLSTTLLSGCEDQAGAAIHTESENHNSPLPVEVTVVKNHSFTENIRITANIMPKRQVKIVPRVPGRIEKIHVEQGDEVEQGQILAQLEQRDYILGLKHARAQLAAAQANSAIISIGVKSASTQKQRMESLRNTHAISQSAYEKADDGYHMGMAKKNAADANVKLARVGVEAARTKLDDTVLKAPFKGLVVKRMLDEGELCGMMPPGIILLLADTSIVHVIGSVGELVVSRVRAGMPATIRADALPGEVFQGTIDIVSPMIDPMTRTSSIQISVQNEDGKLEMGMSAEIEIDLGQRTALALPQDAIIRGSSRDQGVVFLVDGAMNARRREVTLGARQGEFVEIRNGLESGTRVIRSGQRSVRDGNRVSIREK